MILANANHYQIFSYLRFCLGLFILKIGQLQKNNIYFDDELPITVLFGTGKTLLFW